ncbi:hypothetical protein BBJ28_00021301 [Nothophytophthora sp. Chile5]|nr:hypothetical protein BBJ28_00021301 [Nothophytophthora sp. Chile5]
MIAMDDARRAARDSDGDYLQRGDDVDVADEAVAFKSGTWPFGCKGGTWPFGCKGGLEDVPFPKGANSAMINNIMGGTVGDAGEYSFGGQADTLPVLPGLFVDGVGSVPLPLSKEHAEILVARCEKSPFGRKLDTMMDENVRKSWQLRPEDVELKNPLWHNGMKKLSVTIADRLGYKGIPLQCLLYKMLVYDEGGHFLKHQDTEKEDGMVATLVIQLPSLHEGGDLVVYQGGKERARHDFGKVDGSAPYVPHYAVHYADAEHSVDKVTSGHRLVLIYSICLPPNMRYVLELQREGAVSADLTEPMKHMQEADESFTLLLSHEYTDKSIKRMGSGALKGMDRERFKLLNDANTALPEDKKLQLFIARLKHKIDYYDTTGSGMDGCEGTPEWEESKRSDSIWWRDTEGKTLYKGCPVGVELNLLNPSKETLHDMWKEHGTDTFEGFLGNEGATKDTTYSRYAIIGWPLANNLRNVFKFVGEDTAVSALESKRPVNSATLREFMEAASGDQVQNLSPSLGFCKTLCDLLVEANDAALVVVFFREIFNRLKDKGRYADSVLVLVRAFGWDAVGPSFVAALERLPKPERWPKDEGLKLAMKVLRGIKLDDEQTAVVLNLALAKAKDIDPDDLASSRSVDQLWKWALRFPDQSILNDLVAHFKQIDPSRLRRAIDHFSRKSDHDDSTHPETSVALVPLITARMEWLKSEMLPLTQPFSWEMPEAHFLGREDIERFLRGPDASFTVRDFSSVRSAQAFAGGSQYMQHNATFEMKAEGRGRNAYVNITKTRGWFEKRQEKLAELKTEVEELTQRLDKIANGSAKTAGRKRARE